MLIVLFLSVMVAMILVRNLTRDIIAQECLRELERKSCEDRSLRL